MDDDLLIDSDFIYAVVIDTVKGQPVAAIRTFGGLYVVCDEARSVQQRVKEAKDGY